MDVVMFFVKAQIPAVLLPVLIIAILNYFVQKYFDIKEKAEISNQTPPPHQESGQQQDVPGIFAILPLIPLILLLIFSKLMVESIVLNVVTSMFISLLIGMLFNLMHTRDLNETLSGIMIYFKGMGAIFASVVTLIFAAETFAGGLKAVGFIDSLISMTGGETVSSSIVLALLLAILGITAILTGSGNAAFFSFGNLTPGLAAGAGKSTLAFVLPMQLTSGLFRTISPVAGVIIAVSGTAEVDPFTVVKRTVIPMMGGIVGVVAYAWLIL